MIVKLGIISSVFISARISEETTGPSLSSPLRALHGICVSQNWGFFVEVTYSSCLFVCKIFSSKKGDLVGMTMVESKRITLNKSKKLDNLDTTVLSHGLLLAVTPEKTNFSRR